MITLTRRQTKDTKRLMKEEPTRYRWIQPHTTFDYINPKEDRLYDIPIRVVRFEIADSVYETLYTNLPREDFPVDALKYLYHFWPYLYQILRMIFLVHLYFLAFQR